MASVLVTQRTRLSKSRGSPTGIRNPKITSHSRQDCLFPIGNVHFCRSPGQTGRWDERVPTRDPGSRRLKFQKDSTPRSNYLRAALRLYYTYGSPRKYRGRGSRSTDWTSSHRSSLILRQLYLSVTGEGSLPCQIPLWQFALLSFYIDADHFREDRAIGKARIICDSPLHLGYSVRLLIIWEWVRNFLETGYLFGLCIRTVPVKNLGARSSLWHILQFLLSQ